MSPSLATYNIKGGVGKTSAAVNLAYLAARDGARTLLWDLDPQGASTFLFRVKPKVKGGGGKLVRGKSDVDALIKGTDYERLDLLPADFSYRHMDLALDATKKPTRRLERVLAPLARRVRLRLPRLPAEHLAGLRERVRGRRRAARPADPGDAVLAHASSSCARSSARRRDGPQVLAFFSMVDRRKRLHRDVMEPLAARARRRAGTAIPSASDVERMGLHRTVARALRAARPRRARLPRRCGRRSASG